MDCRASETVSEIAELRRYFDGLASAKVVARPRGRWRKFAGLSELRLAPDWKEACWSAILLRLAIASTDVIQRMWGDSQR